MVPATRDEQTVHNWLLNTLHPVWVCLLTCLQPESPEAHQSGPHNTHEGPRPALGKPLDMDLCVPSMNAPKLIFVQSKSIS